LGRVIIFLTKTGNLLPYTMNTTGKKEAIGDTIQSRRKARKIAQEQLADVAGISPRTLRDIEKGIANPELETLIKICNVLGMEIKIEVIK
jgi:y4mF family transcriptional regulator